MRRLLSILAALVVTTGLSACVFFDPNLDDGTQDQAIIKAAVEQHLEVWSSSLGQDSVRFNEGSVTDGFIEIDLDPSSKGVSATLAFHVNDDESVTIGCPDPRNSGVIKSFSTDAATNDFVNKWHHCPA